MTVWKVVIPDRVAPPADVEQSVFGARAEVVALQAQTEAELRGHIEDADAVLAWHDLTWDAALLREMPKCRVIVRVGVGFDNVDLQAAAAQNIAVSNVPDYGTNDVADHAMALLLSLARGLIGYDRCAREGHWSWGLAPSFRITGKQLGIIGLGRIGAATSLRAKAFGMRVGYYDPYKPSGWDKTLGVKRYLSLEELAAESDVVSVHAPLTEETRGMLGAQFFAHTRPGVVLINTARGPVLDWKAFAAAFNEQRIAAAGFDVLPVEPPKQDDPVIAAWIAGDPRVRDRLIITPHCAFYSAEARLEMRRKAAEEALRILSGERPLNPVGLDRPATLP